MTPERKPISLIVRSTVFTLVYVLSTIVYGMFAWLLIVIPSEPRARAIMSWTTLNVWALKVICGLDYRIEGLENIPDQPMIVLAKHQSTWETLALSSMFPTAAWVLKRELLNLPFFGWGLRLLDQIAIDRNAGRNAVEQVIEQGTERLDSGRHVMVFPEGTRMPPGERGRYKLGGAMLAAKSGYPVIAMAHNAGFFWPREQFLKYPGTITMRFSEIQASAGKEPGEINAATEAWIEQQMIELNEDALRQLKPWL